MTYVIFVEGGIVQDILAMPGSGKPQFIVADFDDQSEEPCCVFNKGMIDLPHEGIPSHLAYDIQRVMENEDFQDLAPEAYQYLEQLL